MTKQRAARGLVMVAVCSLAVAPGMAAMGATQDVVVSAAIVDTTGVSYRTLTAANVVLALAANSTTPVLTGTMAPSVSELLMTGSNPWSVGVKLSNDFTRVGGSETLDGTALVLTPGAPTIVQLASGISNDTSATTAGNLDSAGSGVTIMKIIGQNTAAHYTGSYTSSGSLALTVPSGQVGGTYTATMTVTLTY